MRNTLLLIASAGCALAMDYSNLVGTWTTKSNSTITGPQFYDQIQDRFHEPKHPGISYSFTADGHYETAYYRAISNPTSPECVSSVLQFQHGSFEYLGNGSLVLSPIAFDGRQLDSSPCKHNKAIYLRYNQSELMERYTVYVDPYHGIPRLDLYQHNGAPLPPMYLVFKPPQMVPTTTLHPLSSANATGTSSKVKRKLAEKLKLLPETQSVDDANLWLDANSLWWIGVSMTGVGSVLYWCF